MTWIAPEVERVDPPWLGDERAMLDGWLDYQRATLLWKCQGLGADQLRRRTVEPSTLSLLGLVRHMADVERWWFRRNVAGEDLPSLYSSDANPDGDFDDVEAADAAADFAAFLAECELARKVVEGRGLEETFVTRRGRTIDVRWVYVHMIEEYARHNGHADLIRERIDGSTGD